MYKWIIKDGVRKQVPQNRINRFLDEGWYLDLPELKKKSPSKPKASAKVTQTKPKMAITKAKATVVKDDLELEIFEGDSMQELVDDIKGSQKEK